MSASLRPAFRPSGFAALAGAVLSLLGAEVAGAAVVSSNGERIAFTAGFAEANDVTISFTPEAVTVVDAGAPITAGPGCASDAESGGVSCPEPHPGEAPGIALEVALGTRDDRLRLDDCSGELRRIAVSGSVGNDTVTVGACSGAQLTVDAGADDDVVTTSLNHSGTNTLYGGHGRDRLAVNEGGRAFLFGGGGDDELSWNALIFDPEQPTDWVSVNGEAGDDLFRPADLELVERTIFGGHGFDVLAIPPDGGTFDLATCVECDIEGVLGSPSDDVIFGDRRANWISSGAGNDVVDPRGGHDMVFSGDGDDTVTATDGKRDAVRCGSGTADTVLADRRESIGQCEIVRRGGK
jgi:Ca2+-binding RTX toxin-like protein